MGGKRISPETKRRVLKLFQQGYRSKAIASLLALNRSTVEQWGYLYEGGDETWVHGFYSHRYQSMSEKDK